MSLALMVATSRVHPSPVLVTTIVVAQLVVVPVLLQPVVHPILAVDVVHRVVDVGVHNNNKLWSGDSPAVETHTTFAVLRV